MRLQESIVVENKCAESGRIIVSYLDKELPYHDSLHTHFFYAHYSGDVVLTSSAYEAIKSKGFDIINSDSLRTAIIDLYDADYESMLRSTIELEDQFWPTLTLPLYIKHFRFGPGNKSRQYVPKNHKYLQEDTEYVSMVEYRASFREMAATLKTQSLSQTKDLIDRIEQEIAK